MDQPICFIRHRRQRDPPDNLMQKCSIAVFNDDKDEFLRLNKEEQVRGRFQADTIFSFDCLNIGMAVLNGETKGFIDLEDSLDYGMTPLHYAALMCTPRLTKYLIDIGHNVDVMCDYEHPTLPLKQATPLDLTLSALPPYEEQDSLFDFLSWLCHYKRPCIEVVRLLIQNTQNTERVRKSFIHHADKGQLTQLAVLFLAAPELFLSSCFVSLGGGLSSFGIIYLVSQSLDKRTNIEEALSLLLDVFAMIGDKLVAYVRLQETSEQISEQTEMEIDFLLREVSRKKLGVSSTDYYFRFFKALRPEADDLSFLDVPDLPNKSWDDLGMGYEEEEPGPWMFSELPYVLMRKDINQANIYRELPILGPDDADRLNSAIKKKLSSISTLNCCLEGMTRISKKEQKHIPQLLPFLSGRKFEHSVRSFATSAPSANPTNTLVNKVMQETKLKSVFSFVKLVKRLIK